MMRVLIGVHLFGLVMGVGAATTTDVMFARALRRRDVTPRLLRTVERASRAVWTGMALLVASGFGFLALGSPATARFWTKLLIVVVACVNGWIVHQHLLPRLRAAAAGDGDGVPPLGVLQASGAAAAVSAVSWYGAMVLGAWRTLTLPVPDLVAAYLVVALAAAIVGATVAPRIVGSPKAHEPDRVRPDRVLEAVR